MTDLIWSISLVAVVALIGLAYVLRWAFRGRVSHRRVDQDGGSALLGKGVMNGGYWALQPVGRLLHALGIPANAVTGASLVFGVGAAAAAAFGSLGLGATLSTISGLCDSLDGLVARASGKSSNAGEMLDATVDRLVEAALLVGLAVHYRERPVVFVVTLAALIGSYMVSYTSARAEALHIPAPRGAMRRAERAVYLACGAGFSPIFDAATRGLHLPGEARELPMTAALALVALVANLSVVNRVRAMERSLADLSAKPEIPSSEHAQEADSIP